MQIKYLALQNYDEFSFGICKYKKQYHLHCLSKINDEAVALNIFSIPKNEMDSLIEKNTPQKEKYNMLLSHIILQYLKSVKS